MTGGLRIGRIFGIPIYLHPTWLIVFALVLVALGAQLSLRFPEWDPRPRYALAAAIALLFFGSILLHELGHSVLALRHRVAVRSITLFIFGGVALMEREPEDARAEFEIAIAGPVVSAALALLFLGGVRLTDEASAAGYVAGWLFQVNLAVALFNLLPGFPLDGGRVLRAVLWARSGDMRRATRTAAAVGQVIAYSFVGVGAVQALQPELLGVGRADGLWLAFIGWFLLTASGGALRQLDLDAALEGLRAGDLLVAAPARVPPDLPVATFAREWVMRGRRWALVEDAAGRVLGLVTLSDVRRLDPDAWESTPVSAVATPRERILTARPDTPVREVLVAMGSRDVNQIPVLEDDRVVGAVTRETLVHALELRRRMAGG